MEPWIEKFDEQQLFALCPELKEIQSDEIGSPDDVANLVRDEMATTYVTVPMPRNMKPEPDPDAFAELQRSWTEKSKDYKKASVKKFERNKKTYWGQVKEELRLLICTKDKKYADLRKKLNTAVGQAKDPAVVMISAAVASAIGVAVGVVSGLVAVLLFAILKIGVNAFCARASA